MVDMSLARSFYHEGDNFSMSDYDSIIRQVIEEARTIPPCTVTKEARQAVEALLYSLPQFAATAEQAEGLEAVLARQKIARIKAALEYISGDPYYTTIPSKYIHRITDRAAAAICYCDKTNVWRNRNRLLDLLALRLFGVSAWEETRSL